MGGEILLSSRVGVHGLDPTRSAHELLRRSQLPAVGQNASELDIDEGR
jgi:hypothetical protein